jgi:hypothetical protein
VLLWSRVLPESAVRNEVVGSRTFMRSPSTPYGLMGVSLDSRRGRNFARNSPRILGCELGEDVEGPFSRVEVADPPGIEVPLDGAADGGQRGVEVAPRCVHRTGVRHSRFWSRPGA